MLLAIQGPSQMLPAVAPSVEFVSGVFTAGQVTHKDCDYRRVHRYLSVQSRLNTCFALPPEGMASNLNACPAIDVLKLSFYFMLIFPFFHPFHLSSASFLPVALT